mmetsp:Transcript_28725/g.69634  ORF Transcript_28725/g.69634 Transcript_28725/m.69634 type:complete len:696 (-) Transcript_28725:167-2254(-)|eukprot:CAMPEP_0113469054 /NCGR_PEP_ID=MMETSP0014_2-20120614/15692_1 /TAXON_ID=2857 /ORGANISM="Nitzschia sp." /LENGTH=695 /DNA_ID=CAMNT_0000361501 /DNA_START=359 /DNA_END=2446 /DNA_ORIENTATION=+ /assembly_acc=CAM_ASM_000159
MPKRTSTKAAAAASKSSSAATRSRSALKTENEATSEDITAATTKKSGVSTAVVVRKNKPAAKRRRGRSLPRTNNPADDGTDEDPDDRRNPSEDDNNYQARTRGKEYPSTGHKRGKTTTKSERRSRRAFVDISSNTTAASAATASTVITTATATIKNIETNNGGSFLFSRGMKADTKRRQTFRVRQSTSKNDRGRLPAAKAEGKNGQRQTTTSSTGVIQGRGRRRSLRQKSHPTKRTIQDNSTGKTDHDDLNIATKDPAKDTGRDRKRIRDDTETNVASSGGSDKQPVLKKRRVKQTSRKTVGQKSLTRKSNNRRGPKLSIKKRIEYVFDDDSSWETDDDDRDDDDPIWTRHPRSAPWISNDELFALKSNNPCPNLLDDVATNHLLQRPLIGADFDDSIFTSGHSRLDKDSRGEPKNASDYVSDIFQRLYHRESEKRTSLQCVDKKWQKEISSYLRALVVDWVIAVHKHMRWRSDTLYLSIALIDRYLFVHRDVLKTEIQLVSITCMFIACKYEEIWAPELKDFALLSRNACTREEILDMEWKILNALNFRISFPTPLPFLRRFLHLTQASLTVSWLARLYLERMLQESSCIFVYRGSMIAAAAVLLALNNPFVLKSNETTVVGLETMLDYTGFSYAVILEIAEFISKKMKEWWTKKKGTGRSARWILNKYKSLKKFPAPCATSLRWDQVSSSEEN